MVEISSLIIQGESREDSGQAEDLGKALANTTKNQQTPSSTIFTPPNSVVAAQDHSKESNIFILKLIHVLREIMPM